MFIKYITEEKCKKLKKETGHKRSRGSSLQTSWGIKKEKKTSNNKVRKETWGEETKQISKDKLLKI